MVFVVQFLTANVIFMSNSARILIFFNGHSFWWNHRARKNLSLGWWTNERTCLWWWQDLASFRVYVSKVLFVCGIC